MVKEPAKGKEYPYDARAYDARAILGLKTCAGWHRVTPSCPVGTPMPV